MSLSISPFTTPRGTHANDAAGEARALSHVDHRIHLGKYGAMALHFYLTGGANFGTSDPDAVGRLLVEAGTPWSFHLRQALEEREAPA